MKNDYINIEGTLLKYHLPKSGLTIAVKDGQDGTVYDRINLAMRDVIKQALNLAADDATLTGFFHDPEKEIEEHNDQDLDANYSLPYFEGGRFFTIDKKSLERVENRIV